MAVLAECDICGNQHRVKDELVGAKFRCRDCGTEFIVPDNRFIKSAEFIEEGGRLRRRAETPPAPLWPWLFICLLTCLVIGTLIAAVWTFSLMFRPAPRAVASHCIMTELK